MTPEELRQRVAQEAAKAPPIPPEVAERISALLSRASREQHP